MTTGQRDVAIVGVAESDVMGTVPNKSSLQHHAEAAHNALEDAGLTKSDVDGLLTAGGSTLLGSRLTCSTFSGALHPCWVKTTTS